MRFRRQGLTPAKMILIYGLAFLLVLFHESGRLSGWLADLGRSENSPANSLALNLAADLQARTQSLGLASLNQAEDRFFRFLTPQTVIGGRPAPSPASFQAETAPPYPGRTLAAAGPGPDTPAPAGPPADPISPAAWQPPLHSGNGLAGPSPAALDRSGSPPAPGSPDPAGPAEPASALSPAPAAGRSGRPDPAVIILPPRPVKPSFSRILLTGDSMMLEGVGPPLQKILKNMEGVTVSREGRYATGLCRLDVFDWFSYFKGLLDAKKPELVIITLGANDTQDIVDEKGRHQVKTDSWKEIYGQRVTRLLELALAQNVTVFWIGLPIMGREPYNSRTEVINEVTQKACQAAVNCRFHGTWTTLANAKGQYTTFLTQNKQNLRIRAKDLIHLTESGGRIVADEFLAAVQNWAYLGPPPDGTGQPPLAADPGAPEMRRVLSNIDEVPSGLVPPAPVIFNPRNDPEADPDPASAASPPGTESPAGADSKPSSGSGPGAGSNPGAGIEPGANSNPSPGLEPGTRSLAPAGPETVPPAGRPVQSPASLTEVSLPSKVLAKETKYLVYTPRTRGTFPAVFLLPGAEENYQAWSSHFGEKLWALADQHQVALIMIDGDGFGWYLDSPVKKNSQHMTYFFNELLPDVLAKFPVREDQMALMGISMGGHGALTLSMAQPGRFKALAVLSGVTDISSHGDGRTINNYLRLEEILGSYAKNSQRWRQVTAYWQNRENPGNLAQTPVRLTVGLGDRLVLAENRQFHRLLSEKGVNHQYQEDSGGHDWGLWGRQLPGHMEFLARNIK